MANLKTTPVPECLEQEISVLPQTYPESGIFVGYAHSSQVQSLVAQLLTEFQSLPEPPVLNLLVSNSEAHSAKKFIAYLRTLDDANILHVIETQSDSGFWSQDVMELAIDPKDSEPVVLGIPYDVEEGNNVAEEIASACGFSNQKLEIPPEDIAKYESGNYGGNIEPLPGVGQMIGNSMSPALRIELEKVQSQNLIELEVNWLKTGHVDEIISVLRDPASPPPCNFAISFASPSLAMKILAENPARGNETISPSVPRDLDLDEETGQDKFEACFRNQSGRISRNCKELFRANEVYAEIMAENVRMVTRAIQAKTSCENIRTIALPQLFVPITLSGSYGGPDDHALALNPNSVNSVPIRDILVLPAQGLSSLQREIEVRLSPLAYRFIFADPALVHHLDGGLHCTTNTIRVCQPVESQN